MQSPPLVIAVLTASNFARLLRDRETECGRGRMVKFGPTAPKYNAQGSTRT